MTSHKGHHRAIHPAHQDLPRIEEVPGQGEFGIGTSPLAQDTKGKRVRKSPSLLVLVILLPLLCLVFFAIIWSQQERIARLEAELTEANRFAVEIGAQNAFYKKAFEITLDDMRIVSQAFGGEERYAQLARDLREKEIGTVLGLEVSAGNYSLRNPWLWGEYEAKGTVNTSCLSPPVLADTITDEVRITLTWASASNASFYIDGNYLTALAPGRTSFNVLLPTGVHEMDLVSKGAGSVQELYLDTVEIPASAFTEDRGSTWTLFDCEETTTSASTGGQGALRVLVDKK